jgi:hypothetical protein
MSNVHTWPICCMNLIRAGVGIMHLELVKIACNMIYRARVYVPSAISTMSSSCSSAWLGYIVLLEPVPTIISGMANLQTDLTLWARRAIVEEAQVLGAAIGVATMR